MKSTITGTDVIVHQSKRLFEIPIGIWGRTITFEAVVETAGQTPETADVVNIDDVQLPIKIFNDMIAIVKAIDPQLFKTDCTCGPQEACSECPVADEPKDGIDALLAELESDAVVIAAQLEPVAQFTSEPVVEFTVKCTLPAGGKAISGRTYNSENVRRKLAEAIERDLFIYSSPTDVLKFSSVCGKVVDFMPMPTGQIHLTIQPFGPHANWLEAMLNSQSAASVDFEVCSILQDTDEGAIIDEVMAVSLQDHLDVCTLGGGQLVERWDAFKDLYATGDVKVQAICDNVLQLSYSAQPVEIQLDVPRSDVLK